MELLQGSTGPVMELSTLYRREIKPTFVGQLTFVDFSGRKGRIEISAPVEVTGRFKARCGNLEGTIRLPPLPGRFDQGLDVRCLLRRGDLVQQ